LNSLITGSSLDAGVFSVRSSSEFGSGERKGEGWGVGLEASEDEGCGFEPERVGN